MEDKKLTPKESMELIASMIQASKQRVAMSDLRIPTMWATISILTAVAVWVLITTTHNPWFNFIWFAIPVIGLPANILLSAKDRNKNYGKSLEYPPNCSRLKQQDLIIRELEEKRRSLAGS